MKKAIFLLMWPQSKATLTHPSSSNYKTTFSNLKNKWLKFNAISSDNLTTFETVYYNGLLRSQGGNSQNFLSKFVRFFVTLGLKILRLQRLKVVFEVDVIKIMEYQFSMNKLCKSTLKLRKILRICLRSFVNSHPVHKNNIFSLLTRQKIRLNGTLVKL